jgi:hypothetical protein
MLIRIGFLRILAYAGKENQTEKTVHKFQS